MRYLLRPAFSISASDSAPRPTLVAPIALFAICLACSPGQSSRDAVEPGPVPAGPPLYEDRTSDVGIDFVHFNSASGRFYFPEMGGAGGALLDYDQDGDLDAFLVQGALLGDIALEEALFRPRTPLSDRLLRNELKTTADGPSVSFVDVTLESGINATGFGMGVAVGDYDNNGYPDLYITNYGSNQLYRNRGDGTFEDVTKVASVDEPRWSTSAVFVDFDRDGWLDLFVANYVNYRIGSHNNCQGPTGRQEYCGPQAYPGERDRLFRNLRDGTFEDYTSRAGLTDVPGSSGLGVVSGDFNGDGWPDIYVANDLMPNLLWQNQGSGAEGLIRFQDVALVSGSALNSRGAAEASMGVDIGDLDNDGDDDLFMTHLASETNTLYLNDGSGLFEDRTRTSGLAASLTYTGFGTAIIDYDNDGRLDLAAVNGAVTRQAALEGAGDAYPYHQPNQLMRNLGTQSGTLLFEEVTAQAGEAFARSEVSRGMAAGDVDNDGDDDLLVFNAAGPARMLFNQVGQDHHWLGVRAVGGEPSRDMLGARLETVRADGLRIVRNVRTGASYCSAIDPRVRFGLGLHAEPLTVKVTWPDGMVEAFEYLAADRYHTLVQGQGAPRTEPQ